MSRAVLELCVGDPGSGKTGYLFYRAWQHLQDGYRVIVVSTVEDPEEMGRTVPMGAEEADTLSDALIKAGDDRHVVICYDEIGLEVDDNGKPSAALRMLGRFRRHIKIRMFMTTQRPHDLPAKVRDLDVSIVLMRMSDTSSWAFQWVRREFPDAAEVAPHLTPYYWKDGGSEPPKHGLHYVRAR